MFVALLARARRRTRWSPTSSPSDPLDLPDPGAVWTGAAFTVLLVMVLTIAWSGSGRTLGNAFIGLRVITESGKRPTWRRALVRAVIVVYLPVSACCGSW